MTNKTRNIILIGGGGHCKSCIDVIESTKQYNIVGILDLPKEMGKKVLGYEVIGSDYDIIKYKELGYSFLVTTGQIKSSHIRKRIFENLKKINAPIETVISPTSRVSKHAIIGNGTVIHHHCVVNAGANIGDNCIINTGAIIEHDAIIGSHIHVSTNSVVNGDAKVGDNSLIGSNTCISSGTKVGTNIVIGAGSTVIKDLVEQGTYIGTPARKI